MGNPCCGCCPGLLCGIGGPAGGPMGTEDPVAVAEPPEGAIPAPCVSSEPPLNCSVPSPWPWDTLEPLENNAHSQVYSINFFFFCLFLKIYR